MTSPGNIDGTLTDALDKYAATQEIMKDVAAELRSTENATRAAAGLPIGEGYSGPVLPQP